MHAFNFYCPLMIASVKNDRSMLCVSSYIISGYEAVNVFIKISSTRSFCSNNVILCEQWSPHARMNYEKNICIPYPIPNMPQLKNERRKNSWTSDIASSKIFYEPISNHISNNEMTNTRHLSTTWVIWTAWCMQCRCKHLLSARWGFGFFVAGFK